VSTRPGRLVELLFLATVFTITFEKIHWETGVTVNLADILATLFVAGYLTTRFVDGDGWLSRTALVATAFAGAFLLVYLTGYFNLETEQALAQFAKGMVKFALHFGFLVAGIAYLARRSQRFYWTTLGVFVGGMAVNAAYGLVQLAAAELGYDLDRSLLSPLTGGASSINIYGAVEGADVYRPNALTGDPNHLGIMLVVPLLVLTPLYLRLERGHRLRLPLAVLLSFLLLAEVATLSRSGLVGLAAGLVILAFPYRRLLVSRASLVPLSAVGLVLAYVVSRRLDFFETVLRQRLQTSSGSTSAHFEVYDFVPHVLESNPLLGLGLNNFSVYYEFATGKTDWGPHSFYVALLVETGIVGTALFAAFLVFLFRRLRVARGLGRTLADARDPLAAGVRPLAWGLTAALVGTMAANAFYLTMQFYYFYAFAQLALTAPIVFGRRP
jgi:O-antigen ligase